MATTDLRRYELVEGSSSKFWEIQLSGSSFSVRFGRIGTNGQTQLKSFDSEDKAKKEYDKLVAEKTKKGYSEVAAGGGSLAGLDAVAGAPPATAERAEPAAEKPTKVKAKAKPAEASSEEDDAATPSDAPAVAPSIRGASTPVGAGGPMPVVASADEDRVHWSDALLRRIYVRRGGRAVRVTALPSAKKAWAAAKAAWDNKRAERLARSVSERLAGHEITAQLVARMSAAEPVAGSVDEDASLIAALTYRPDWQVEGAMEEAIEASAALSGLPHAVTATLRALDRAYAPPGKTYHSDAAPALSMSPSDDYGSSFAKHGNLLALPRLRALLAVTDDATYTAARDAAAAVRAAGTSAQRAASTFLFPTEADWVADDLVFLKGGEYTCLLACVHRAEQLSGLVVSAGALYPSRWVAQGSMDLAAALIDGCGLDAVDFIAALDLAYLTTEQRRDHYDLLAALGHDRAVSVLVASLEQREAQAALSAAALLQPRRVLRLAAVRAAERGKSGEPARNVLGGVVRRFPELVAELLPSLPPEAQRALEAIRGAQGEAVADAAPEAVPAFLRAPPWRAKGPRVTPPVVSGVAAPAAAPVMVWGPGERERWKVRPKWGAVEHPPETWKKLAASTADVTVQDLACAPPELAAALAPRTVRGDRWSDGWLKTPAGVHELSSLPFYERLLREEPAVALGVIGPFGASQLALPVAEALREKKSLRGVARAWLLRHPEHAVAGLLAAALQAPGRARAQAEAALRFLAANGHEATVLGLAERAGVKDTVAAVLAFDPLQLYPTKLPKLPSYVEATALPRPVLTGGRGALPVEATEHVLTMLAFSTFDEPYAGLAMVKDACEPASLARFAWAIFSAWLTNGASSKEGWCMSALGFFGDDECARKLAALVREWPGEAAHARAVSGLDVLAAIGSDVALMHLNGIALKVKFKGLQAKAEEKIEQIAEARGFTREELEDRLAPDLGLDDDGSLLLDFGPRQFRVGFDEQLRPFTKDAAGSRLKDLPKPNKSDDEEKAKAASERWSQLKKDAKMAAALQILRLELAMCGKRRFPADTFVELFVKHPLVFHIVRRLVWATYDGDDRVTALFRVAEDRTLADAAEDVWSLPGGATVGIPHALELGAADLAKWSQVLADYEILQPFAQLGRPIYTPTEAERGGKALDRTKGLKVPTGKVLGLEARRWRRGAPQDAGVVGWMEKPLPGGRTAILDLDPGLYTGMLSESPEQTLGSTTIVEAGTEYFWSNQGTVLLGQLDPIAFSELVRDLEALRG